MLVGTAATVIWQIGSIAVPAAAGALVSSGSSRMREGARRSSMIWAKTDNATSSGVRAPMSSPAGA
ncbi:unannotated protein [freshwater metagenome]|uniref:Unannotated protein n=1 Tax=freshwater metagenome TaxID=449393 RepID=A0A6J7MWI9_9ZZZZ